MPPHQSADNKCTNCLVIIMEIWYPSQYKDDLFWIFFILKKRRSWGRPILWWKYLYFYQLYCAMVVVSKQYCFDGFSPRKKRQRKLMNYPQRMYFSTCCVLTEVINSNMINTLYCSIIVCFICFNTTQYMFISPQAKFTAKTHNIVANGQQCCGPMVIFQSKCVTIFLLIDEWKITHDIKMTS